MTRQRTLLFVGAHPDDETFGIGGTPAQYAAAGVRVYYACATRGEAGSVDPEQMQGHATLGDMRWAELKCAAQILGLADVIYLGYRDSGMPGAEDNRHPEALAAAQLDQVVGRIVKVAARSGRRWWSPLTLSAATGTPTISPYTTPRSRLFTRRAIRDSTPRQGRLSGHKSYISPSSRAACLKWR